MLGNSQTDGESLQTNKDSLSAVYSGPSIKLCSHGSF
uniref:Uncharacterized protein n=1 Tax=Anguilla anguilla TaxID=7936 RepID=A0A0E9VI42_ANGAN